MARDAKPTPKLACIDGEWAENELIPLLDTAYGKRPAGVWKESIRQAMLEIDDLTIYESFDTTVERFRLLLINKEILTRAEIQDFGWLREDTKTCIGVFVRHAMYHGKYKLHSMGTAPDPDGSRLADTTDVQDAYIYGAKLSMKRPNVFGKKGDKQKSKAYSAQKHTQDEPAVERRSREPSFKVEWPSLFQDEQGDSASRKTLIETVPVVSHAPSSDQPCQTQSEFQSRDVPEKTVSEVRPAAHMLPRHTSHGQSEMVALSNRRRTMARGGAKPTPGHVPRGPASQSNAPGPNYADRQRRRPQNAVPRRHGYAPNDRYGMSHTYQPRGVSSPTMTQESASMYSNPQSSYRTHPQANGGHPMPYSPHGSFAPSLQLDSNPHMPPHYNAPVATTYPSVPESSYAALEVTETASQPSSARAKRPRIDANEFVPGDNEYSF